MRIEIVSVGRLFFGRSTFVSVLKHRFHPRLYAVLLNHTLFSLALPRIFG